MQAHIRNHLKLAGHLPAETVLSVDSICSFGVHSFTPSLPRSSSIHGDRNNLGSLANPPLTSGKMLPRGGLTTRDTKSRRHNNQRHRDTDAQPGVNMKKIVFKEGSVSCARRRISTDGLHTGCIR